MKKILIGFIALVLTLGVITEIKADVKPIFNENPFGLPHVHAGIDRKSLHNPVIGWINGHLGYICSGNGSAFLGCTFFENYPEYQP